MIVTVTGSGPLTDEMEDQMDDDNDTMLDLVTAAGHLNTPGAFIGILNGTLSEAEFAQLLSHARTAMPVGVHRIARLGCFDIEVVWEATSEPSLYFTSSAVGATLPRFCLAASVMYSSAGIDIAIKEFETALGLDSGALLRDGKVRLCNRQQRVWE
jgi:hypothetical protein